MEGTSTGTTIRIFDNGCLLKSFIGTEVEPFIEQIGALVLTVFREFPYLYEGELANAINHLRRLTAHGAETLLLCASDPREGIVGFMNAIPLASANDEVQKPFREKGYNLADYWYFGELMVLPRYRTAELVRICCDYYKQRARAYAYKHAIFITVDRPSDHPAKPAQYRPLDPLWHRLGFAPIPGMKIETSWRQVDTGKEESNTLSVWVFDIENSDNSLKNNDGLLRYARKDATRP